MIEQIKAALTPDLLKPEYRGSDNPMRGHCYVASEAYWHLSGKVGKPMRIRHEGSSHWFIKEGDTIIDITASQFETPVPYENGIGCGFLTKNPSKRAQTVIDRVLE